jgi:hypothetical protein
MSIVTFDRLTDADLVIDATYQSDRSTSSIASEPLGRLTGTGNQGGFRFSGPIISPHVVVLYSTMSESDWPDAIDEENGLFYYYGDNRKPGFELHDRKAGRGGNLILRSAFARAHGSAADREAVPPFLIFSKGERGRDAVFRGLAVPGAVHLDQTADLTAIWKSIGGQRFQNYRAVFTILDCGVVDRRWLTALRAGEKTGPYCPPAYRAWIEKKAYRALRAEKVKLTRSPAAQLGSPRARDIGRAVYDHFKLDPIAFEHFAADVARMMDANIVALDVTRPSRDGGRDGIGRYRIGLPANCITVDFAVEAKCFDPKTGLGVKVLARLISRLRHRQFGMLVTTSFLASQAYEELIEDAHPIVVMAGGDIAELLVERMGLSNATDTTTWLRSNYPHLALKTAD